MWRQKRKKPTSGKLGIRRDHPRRRIEMKFLHGGWSSGGSAKIRVSSKSIKRFRSCGVEVCPFPLICLLAYTTACTIVQAVTSRDILFYTPCSYRFYSNLCSRCESRCLRHMLELHHYTSSQTLSQCSSNDI